MKISPTLLVAPNQPIKRHSAGWSLLAIFLALAFMGCKPQAKIPADQAAADVSPSGVYNLATVNGKPVPCSISHEGADLAVQSGVFTITGEGACTSKITFSVPSHGDMIREVKATYTRQGAKLTLTWEGAGMTTGTVEGNKFTMDNEGMVFVYQK